MISSPSTVLASSLQSTLDLIQVRLEMNKPKQIVFSVGFEMDGIPHVGTYLMQCVSFLLAEQVQALYGIKTSIRFSALDNSTYTEIHDNASNHLYQIIYGHMLTREALEKQIQRYYLPFFQKLQAATHVTYTVNYYGDTQRTSAFRQKFFHTLSFNEQIRWYLAPDNGIARIRIPCPICYYAEKEAERTMLLDFSTSHATYRCICNTHNEYRITFSDLGSEDTYLDLNVLYRNLVKELVAIDEKDTLHVIMKGGDWVFGTIPVDWALGAMGYFAHQLPMRIFTPQIVTGTGAKLSKSSFREKDETIVDVPTWLLDMEEYAKKRDDYADRIISVANLFLSNPRHMFRSYSCQEIARLLE